MLVYGLVDVGGGGCGCGCDVRVGVELLEVVASAVVVVGNTGGGNSVGSCW